MNDYEYSDFNSDFEAENPVITKVEHVQSLFAEEVIAKSFIFMFCALLITAVTALTMTPERVFYMLLDNIFYLVAIAEIVIVLVSNVAISKNKPILAGVLYVAYSYLNGVTMSVIFLTYTASSVASIFFITAALFGIMAVYGLVTGKDLSSLGNLCFMGLIGIIISALVNMLILKSAVVDTVICSIGVLVFVGLTAYDTQKMKARVACATDETVLSLALFGGFELYLDFINLFLKLLRLLGKRK